MSNEREDAVHGGNGIMPSRRDAIRAGLAALGAAGLLAVSPPPAFAGTGPFAFGAYNDAGEDGTTLASSAGMQPTLTVSNTAMGDALSAGISDEWSVATAVNAATQGRGSAVLARNLNTSNESPALIARTYGTGCALYAQGATPGSPAVVVDGKLNLSRAGRAYIKLGASSVVVTVPGGAMTSASVILCTAQDSAGTGVYIRYAARISATQFKIQLNKGCTSSVYVGWMVLG